MKKILLCIFGLFLSVIGNSQNVISHTLPGEFTAEYYSVTVNGKMIPVFHAGLNVYFASFDFTGSVEVIVKPSTDDAKYAGQTSNKETAGSEAKGYWHGSVQVRPLSANVQPVLKGETVTFSLSKEGQYSVERAGTGGFKDDVLLIFANRPDVNPPSFNNPNVIHLKDGIHQRNVDLKSGQTLYLDAGAVLFGAVNVFNANNVRILGRGTILYYGPQSEDHDDGWKNQRSWHPLTTHNVHGLTVQGVTFVGRSRTWSLQTHTTFDAVFDNIKIIAVNPQNINGDGIDWYGGGHTKVINSFIRSMDDCFGLFTAGSCKDMWATSNNTSGEVKDIYIDNCVLWTTLANIFRIGFNSQALTTENIVMKNTDVIHISKNEWYAPWALLCAVSPNSKGKAKHTKYLMENIRFEEPASLFGLQNPEATFDGIHFKNIQMTGTPVPSLVKSKLRNVVFDNIVLDDKLIATEADIPLTSESKIESIQFNKK